MTTPPCGCSARSTGWWRRISCFPRWAMSSGSVCAGERQPPRRQALCSMPWWRCLVKCMPRSPEVATRAAHLGASIRFESSLAAAERELAILATARAMDCRYEWAAHVPLAEKAGVRLEAITAIRGRQAPAGLTPAEAEIVAYATELLGGHRVGGGLFEGLRKRLGARGMVELTATVGYYAMIASTLNAFEVEPEPGADHLPV